MTDTTSSTSRQLVSAEPLVDGALYLCGGMVALDGRLSWVPAEAKGFQPVNAYALVEGTDVLLVDTGVASHEALVLEQLAGLVAPGDELKVFLTRSEMDCISNLGAINERFGISELSTGGLANPFDAFDDARSALAIKEGRRKKLDDRSPLGDSIMRTSAITVSGDRTVEIESPVLRLLPSFWGWDEATRTLFTSDIFGHTVCANADDSHVIDEHTDDPSTIESVKAHLFAKFEWLARAKNDAFRAYLVSTFERRQPEIVAPTRGCALKGRTVVERHFALLMEALSVDASVDRPA